MSRRTVAVALALLAGTAWLGGLAGARPAAAQTWTATWTPKASALDSPAGPGARGWIDLTYDLVAGRVVLVGGSASVYRDDVWHYAAAGDAWTSVEPQTSCAGITHFVPPSGRDEHAVEYDGFNRLYWMFGGSGYGCKGAKRTAGTGSGSATVVDPALTDPTVDRYKDWTVEIVSSGTRAYVAGYDPATATLTLATPLGGLGAGTAYYLYPQRGGGTWYYSPVTHGWASLTGPHWQYTGPSPISRLSPGLAYSPVDRALVMFGGQGRNDTWALDAETRTWLQLRPQGAAGSPPNLAQITNGLVYDSAHDVFVLFGGCLCTGDAGPSSAQTWVYRLSTNAWTQVTPPLSPPGRQQHMMAFDPVNGVTVLFGGYDRPTRRYFNDLWVYDHGTATWTQVTASPAPPARKIAGMAYDAAAGVIVLYAGFDGGSRRDVWTLRLERQGGPNPVPSVASLTPASAPAGSPAFTLLVSGTGFVGTSIVRWNGNDRPTSFVDSTRLQAQIAAADVADAGKAQVTVFSPEPGGGTSGALSFTIAPAAPAVEVVVDNAAAGVQDASRGFTGTWCASGLLDADGGSTLWSCGSAADTYRWTPDLAAPGTYAVYVRWAAYSNRSAAAPFTVVHATGAATRTLDQRVNGGQWMLHGQYTFAAGTGGYVQLSDAGGLASADAVRFVPVP